MELKHFNYLKIMVGSDIQVIVLRILKNFYYLINLFSLFLF